MTDLAARQAIIDAMVERLEPLVGTDGEFDVNASGEPSHFPSIFLEETDQTPDDRTEPAATRYTLPLIVEGYVEGSGGLAATRARSALYLSVMQAVFGEPLHDIVEEIHEGPMRLSTAILAEKRRLGFILRIEIIFPATSISPVA